MADQTCSFCAFNNPAGFNFCGHCGNSLNSTTSQQPTISALKNATDHSPSLATFAQANTSPPRVDRRQLTVLFCDMVGSTALSQQFDPEDLRKIIRSYQKACQPVIESHGGYISRYIGDGILAFFGYPRASEHDAEQAVNAGLGLVQSVSQINCTALQGKTPSLLVRVGIATGIVVAGDLIGEGA